ncbi:MAG: hypothetical protein Ct9H300mP19_13690 [Dehalococcoidia bacterium]|nr:MAG: hypothetical protein Ct9H300mP19_13690 [Dehalococcoidia bacterium]
MARSIQRGVKRNFHREMARTFPKARTAIITRFTVVKMLEATFRVSVAHCITFSTTDSIPVFI